MELVRTLRKINAAGIPIAVNLPIKHPVEFPKTHASFESVHKILSARGDGAIIDVRPSSAAFRSDLL